MLFGFIIFLLFRSTFFLSQPESHFYFYIYDIWLHFLFLLFGSTFFLSQPESHFYLCMLGMKDLRRKRDSDDEGPKNKKGSQNDPHLKKIFFGPVPLFVK
jgi:hypothetical protein